MGQAGDIAVKTKGVSKAYHVYGHPSDRLRQLLFGRFRTYYRNFWALQDFDAEIRRGESLALIGRNGSGKSTALQIIAGIVTPSAGTVQVNGRVAALLELGAGFNPEFTGRDNVYLSAMVMGLSRAEVDERFESIAAFANIGDFMNQPVKIYSSGMYARLAFAVVAHVDADILIVDEILSVGDAAFVQKCMRFINEFRRDGTLIFVSHDSQSVLSLCDRAIWLDQGETRESGPARDVCLSYLAALHSEKSDANRFKIGAQRKKGALAPVQDYRATSETGFLDTNPVEVSAFRTDSPWFGEGGLTIVDAAFRDKDGNRLERIYGGQPVLFQIDAVAKRAVRKVFGGFLLKNARGQEILGDNNFLDHRDSLKDVAAGGRIRSTFRFQMPYLPDGEYTVAPAVTEHLDGEHFQQHWMDRALVLTVRDSPVGEGGGAVALPMMDVELERGSAPDAGAGG